MGIVCCAPHASDSSRHTQHFRYGYGVGEFNRDVESAAGIDNIPIQFFPGQGHERAEV